MPSLWDRCLSHLQQDLPAQQFNTWIRPLSPRPVADSELQIIAPNRFVQQWVEDRFLTKIEEISRHITDDDAFTVSVALDNGSAQAFSSAATASSSVPSTIALERAELIPALAEPISSANPFPDAAYESQESPAKPETIQAIAPKLNLLNHNVTEEGDHLGQIAGDSLTSAGREHQQPARISDSDISHKSNVNADFVFDNFIVGKSNQLALAAATQVAENPGGAYNPLFIYGGVGLGKTHLMHAVGNALLARKPDAKVIYLHSERFVADMVRALRMNAISEFKRYYRSVDALLIDDIQFFAKKDRSQEEFFHTFNALLEGNQQVILTCDRYPKEVEGLEERLKSRFGWGLTVAVEPPELETRVAILKKKADEVNMALPDDAAFFIAQRIRSNVRELEGALKRVIANAHFINQKISVPLVQEALKDLLALQDRLVSVDNIQRVVAEYYKIKISDLHAKRRTRSIARPRQVAMYLAKELTNHSLPEIGDSFGGRDHTTVLHACRKIKELEETSSDIREDVKNLLRTLTT